MPRAKARYSRERVALLRAKHDVKPPPATARS
jgi:hypothetical protein